MNAHTAYVNATAEVALATYLYGPNDYRTLNLISTMDKARAAYLTCKGK